MAWTMLAAFADDSFDAVFFASESDIARSFGVQERSSHEAASDKLELMADNQSYGLPPRFRTR